MDKREIKKSLRNILGGYYVYSEEYQDKYYLIKDIKEHIPQLDENSIVNAINYANVVVAPPRKIRKFINAFVNKIGNIS
jgi:hypothetical protein